MNFKCCSREVLILLLLVFEVYNTKVNLLTLKMVCILSGIRQPWLHLMNPVIAIHVDLVFLVDGYHLVALWVLNLHVQMVGNLVPTPFGNLLAILVKFHNNRFRNHLAAVCQQHVLAVEAILVWLLVKEWVVHLVNNLVWCHVKSNWTNRCLLMATKNRYRILSSL